MRYLSYIAEQHEKDHLMMGQAAEVADISTAKLHKLSIAQNTR